MTFTFGGQSFELFDHKYNATIKNERAVEVPIAKAFVEAQPPGTRGLEVGNVLSHYGVRRERRIVDLNERTRGVESADLLFLTGSYDWIVSISTVEHVRQHENQYGGIAALAYLMGLLAPGGHALVTVGMGQNPALDQFLLFPWSAPWPRSTAFGLAGRMMHRRGASIWYESGHSPLAYEPGDGAGSSTVWIGEA